MKTILMGFALGLAIMVATPAVGQSSQNRSSANWFNNGPDILPKGCSCSGGNPNGTSCSCSCSGSGCACVCSSSGGCRCGTFAPTEISLAAGTTVAAAAEKISSLGLLPPAVTVLAGDSEVLPSDINATTWQALARLSMLPGVRLGVALATPQSLAAREGSLGFASGGANAPTALREIQRLPLSQTISVCVHKDAGLPAVLDALSGATGYAFDVAGTPKAHFTLAAKGTLDEVISQLWVAVGASIAVAQ